MREERLLCEAETAARLSHPNIVTLFDAGRAPQGPYLVMELLRGCTLARRPDPGPLPLREALRIAIEVAKGLAHAHAHGVVHRDLTPGNIFLCEDGQVKVLDLGLAHAFGHRKIDGGTPSYMAPEQRRGAPEDERTDVFAMGVILVEMLTGELPFPADGGKSLPESAKTSGRPDIPEWPLLAKLRGGRQRTIRQAVACARGSGGVEHPQLKERARIHSARANGALVTKEMTREHDA